MKRITSIIILLFMVLSVFGCSGGTKNQVVHVEETAQYGDLKFTFLEYELKHMSSGTYPRIHLLIENNGNNKYRITAREFDVFADNNDIGHCDSGYPWTDGRAGNCSNEYLELQPGRSGEIWVNYTICDISDYNIIEFDYVYSPFAERWGKITFAMDLNDGLYNQTDSNENLDLDKAIIGTWQFMDTKHEYADDFYKAYTFFDDNTGVFRINNNAEDFVYYLDDNALYINSKYSGDCELDGKYLTLVYWFGNVATKYYYEKVDNYTVSSESLDPDKAFIGTWELSSARESYGFDDYDYSVVTISFYDDATCWCQYNDGRSEHLPYIYQIYNSEGGDQSYELAIQINDYELLNGRLPIPNDHDERDGLELILYNSFFKGYYFKEGSSGRGAFLGEAGG